MNESVFILIKDYGVEGQKVFGVTTQRRIVEMWLLGDYCWVICADVEGKITNEPLPAVRI